MFSALDIFEKQHHPSSQNGISLLGYPITSQERLKVK